MVIQNKLRACEGNYRPFQKINVTFLPAVDWSIFANTTNNIGKLSTKFEKPKAPTEMSAVRLSEKNPLDPIEGQNQTTGKGQ